MVYCPCRVLRYSIFRTILEKKYALLAFFISNIVGNIFKSSSECKPCYSLVYVKETFKKYCVVSFSQNLRDTMSKS